MQKYISAVISISLLLMQIPVASAYNFLGANLVSQQLPDLVLNNINVNEPSGGKVQVAVYVSNVGGYVEFKNMLATIKINNTPYKVIDVVNSIDKYNKGIIELETYGEISFTFDIDEASLIYGENIFEIEIDSGSHIKEVYEQNNFEDYGFEYILNNKSLPDLITRITDIEFDNNELQVDYEVHNIGGENAKTEKEFVYVVMKVNGDESAVNEHQNRNGNIFLPPYEHTFSLFKYDDLENRSKMIDGWNTVEICVDKGAAVFYVASPENGDIEEKDEYNNCVKKDFKWGDKEPTNNQIKLFAEYMPHNGFYSAELTSYKQGNPHRNFITDAEVWLDSMHASDKIRCMAITEGCGWYRMEYSDSAGIYMTTTPLYLDGPARITASYGEQSDDYVVRYHDQPISGRNLDILDAGFRFPHQENTQLDVVITADNINDIRIFAEPITCNVPDIIKCNGVIEFGFLEELPGDKYLFISDRSVPLIDSYNIFLEGFFEDIADHHFDDFVLHSMNSPIEQPWYPESPCEGTEGIKGYYDENGTYREYEGEVITTDQCVNNPFVDVNPNNIQGKAAIELQARNIINGFEDGTYRGENAVNRAQVTKFLLNGAGYDAEGYENNGKFSDVLEGQWYTKYVSKAAELGIVKGYGDGQFGPENQVLRAELIVMITRAFDLEEYIESSYKFDDVDSESWVNEYAGIADLVDMFPDNHSSLNPYETLTRNEVGVAIYQTLMAIENGDL